MNISKQAIEAGAKAIRDEYFRSNGFTNKAVWDSCTAAAKEHWQEMARVGLTAALEHILQEVLGPVTDEEHDIASRAWIDASGGSTKVACNRVLSDRLSHLRGEGKQADCNIQPQNVKSPPEIETQVEISPYDVERVARAMWQVFNADSQWEKKDEGVRDMYRKEATAAIRAMKGQLWGVECSGPGNDGCWLLHQDTSKGEFWTTDRLAADLVCGIMRQTHGPIGKYEVRPYPDPVQVETPEEIARRCLAPVSFWGTDAMKKNCEDNIAAAITAERARKGVGDGD